jgi:hypothetical protein
VSTPAILASAVRQLIALFAAALARAFGGSSAPAIAGHSGEAVFRNGTYGPQRVARWLSAVALMLGALLALGATPASAATQYPFLGQLPPLSSNTLGLAVDGQNGNALVGDSAGNQDVIRIFAPSGALLTTIDGSGTPAGSFGGNGFFQFIAADDASGGFYATDRHTSPEVIDRFDASGTYVCQISGVGSATGSASECDSADPATPSGDLGDLGGIAVDQASGNLYAYDSTNRVVDVFDPSGKYLRQIDGSATPAGSFGAVVHSLAVDDHTGHLLVADSGLGVVYVLDAATGAYITSWDGSAAANPPGTPAGSFGGSPSVAADNSTGDVYVGNPQFAVVDQLDSSGNYLGQITGIPGGSSFTLGDGVAVAVDQPGHRLYVLRQSTQLVDIFADQPVIVPDVTTGAASPVATTTATVNGHLDPAGGPDVSDCHFEWGTDTSYGHSTPCAEGNSFNSPSDVHADLTGLAPDTTYHFRLSAANANGTNIGADQTFTTLPVPVLHAVAAANLTPTDADLTAQINPRGLDTTYHFEYGTDTSYGSSVPIPDAAIGSGTTDVAVSQHITGLTANTTYHFRLLATNANGTTTSADHTFIYDTTGQGLPDGRGYEQVTPVQKNGALTGNVILSQPPHLSQDGSRLVLTAIQCFADAGSCPGDRGTPGSPYQFTRTDAGWLTTPLSPPATQFDLAGTINNSPDAGTALFTISTPPGGEDDWYLRQPDGSFVDIGPRTAPASGVTKDVTLAGSPSFGTANLSHLAWQPHDFANFWAFDSTTHGSGGSAAYQYAGTGNSQPMLVGVSGGAGSTDLIGICGTELGGSGNRGGEGAMSADGRTVYFTTDKCSSGSGANASTPVPADALYARIDGELSSAHTVPISQRSPLDCTTPACQGSAPRDAFFEGASDDGFRVFFASTQQLTDSAAHDDRPGDTAHGDNCHQTTDPGGCNLYLYDSANPTGHELIDASAGDVSGGGPRVQGVSAISSDGSHAYFVAQGVLPAVPNAQGQTATDNADNLYAYDADTGDTAFIATLLSRDRDGWQNGPGVPANVTPDGRFLVFRSSADLTPDTTSSGAQQIFRYDAQSGELIRISIGNKGFNDDGNVSLPDCGFISCPQDATFPGFISQLGPARRDPTMSHDGAYVFFQSPLALTPHASDQVPIGTDGATDLVAYAQNVYEYHAGHVSLISDGRDASAAPGGACQTLSSICLVGTDASGQNVMFSTADQLVPQDTDTQLDYYDARIGGGFPYTPLPQPCSGDACQGTPSGAPGAPTAASVTFTGPGNAPGAAPTTAKVKILTKVVHGSRFLVSVKVPEKGRITISGTRVKTAARSISKAGNYKLRVTLTATQKRALRHKRRLKLRLRARYTPIGGTPTTVSFALTDKA